jgi:hypothetical protein
MVKLRFYKRQKTYKNSDYTYEEVSLRFPNELHEVLSCLRNCSLDIKVSREDNKTIIVLIDEQAPA